MLFDLNLHIYSISYSFINFSISPSSRDLPSTIRFVDYNAFANLYKDDSCKSLSSIIIPHSVSRICFSANKYNRFNFEFLILNSGKDCKGWRSQFRSVAKE